MAYKVYNGKAVWTRGTWLFTHREETNVVDVLSFDLEHGDVEYMDLTTGEGPYVASISYFLDNAELVTP